MTSKYDIKLSNWHAKDADLMTGLIDFSSEETIEAYSLMVFDESLSLQLRNHAKTIIERLK